MQPNSLFANCRQIAEQLSSNPSNKSSDASVCWADKSQTLLKISLRCLSRKKTIVLLYFGGVIDTSMSNAYELAKKSANSVSSSLSQL